MEIVSSYFTEDLQWLEKSPYPVHIVAKEGCLPFDDKKFSSSNIIPNFANEAGSYLWFIANNYSNLPDKIVFIHGHENSVHQKVPIFKAIELYKDFSFIDINRHINYYVRIVPNSDYEKLWNYTVRPFLIESIPRIINFRSSAQFIVSKELILRRNLDFWKHLYEITLKICIENQHFSKKIAIFYENIWHIIFNQESPMFNDYQDVFADSEFKSYNLWEFLKEISKND